MGSGPSAGWQRVHTTVLAAVAASSCATGPHPESSLIQRECRVVVQNRTPLAVEVRLRVRALSTAPIGALNPGELLTHSVPCAEQRVLVVGIEIPWQVGAGRRFGAVYGEAELIEGERAQIVLYWP